jgi:4-diphosphocytidyl-2C-methyl-D-erythritol kinase
LGKKLGADIPFFLKGVNQAIGKGRGDLILARPARKRKWFLLVTSSRGLSTKRLYANLEQRVQAPSRFVSLTKASRVIRITCDFLDQPNFSGVEGLLRNDLELPASRLRPSIQKIKTKISELGSPLVGMSGSGPTVFAIFSSEKEARRLARELKQRLSSSERMIVCHTF